MNFSFIRRIIKYMKSIRKFIALTLILWTPLFFSGALYAATQMELANATVHELAQKEPSCHEVNADSSSAHEGMKHPAGDAHCKHCSFCASFAAPFNEIKPHAFPPMSSLAFSPMWTSSNRNPTPDHPPPIDA